ncbi:MAG: hypothetical protein MRY74_02000 [Neomegalonema sp.]|nr:hypothetical protein [Neomegalonema sp.]
MLFRSAILCLSLTLGALAQSQASAQSIATAATVDDLIGNTIVGVTDSGGVWGASLYRDGEAAYLFVSGKRASARWRRADNQTLCFEFDDGASACKVISSAGQGLHWRTEGDSKISSQLILLLPLGVYPDQSSYRSTIRRWRGAFVVGRTKKDREIWYADLQRDGSFTFSSTGGSIRSGSYELRDGEVCFYYSDDTAAHCRRPEVDGETISWVDTLSGSAISDIVYLHFGRRR